MMYRRTAAPAGRRMVIAVPVLCCLLVAACGQSRDRSAGSAPDGSGRSATERPVTGSIPDLAYTTGAAEESDDAGSAGSTGQGRVYEADVDALAFAAGVLPTTAPTTTVPPTTGASTTAAVDATPQTTSGRGGAPVTTGGGGGGGDTSIYIGVIASIGPDQLITPAVAPAPAATPGILPLTGLPGQVPDRPAAVVKIDNGSPARPQTGLNAADIVVEEEVEGGITRFAAIFHSTSSIVGPIRSGRTTDIGVLNSLGSPLMMYSGANAVTDTLIRAQSTVQNRNAGTSSGYWRSSSRRAPSNLYSDTAPHWASATGGPPPPQFAYRADGATVGGVDAGSFKVSYRASKASWSWDGSAWLRSQGGRAHKTEAGAQVSAANVVVIEAREVPTGMVDSSGATVPEFVFVGNGKATVFTAGRRIEGIWTKPTLRSVATLTTADGSVIELTPGRTWIELIGAGSGLLQ